MLSRGEARRRLAEFFRASHIEHQPDVPFDSESAGLWQPVADQFLTQDKLQQEGSRQRVISPARLPVQLAYSEPCDSLSRGTRSANQTLEW
jgi:hypothetical protein